MNWFIVESTTGDGPQHRYSINAEYMKIDGELVVLYGHQGDRVPTRVLKLQPGQIIFMASKEQVAMIEKQCAAALGEPKGAVQ